MEGTGWWGWQPHGPPESQVQCQAGPCSIGFSKAKQVLHGHLFKELKPRKLFHNGFYLKKKIDAAYKSVWSNQIQEEYWSIVPSVSEAICMCVHVRVCLCVCMQLDRPLCEFIYPLHPVVGEQKIMLFIAFLSL